MSIQQFYIALVLLMTIVACGKDELPYAQWTGSKDMAFISFPRATRGMNDIQIFPTAEERTFTFRAGFGALGLSANDIDVSIEEDLRAFDSVNNIRELNGLLPYERFPRGSYTLDNRDMVILAGELSSSPIHMTYYPASFDPDTDYLLALSITKSSGYAVFPAGKTLLIGAHRREPHQIFISEPTTGSYLNINSTNPSEQFLFDLGLDIANPLSGDIMVTVTEDPAVLQTINNDRIAKGLTPFETFPSEAYSLDKSVLTIAGGSRSSDQGILTYRPASFDPTINYVLPLTITDASGFSVDTERKTLLVHAIQEERANTTGWIADASSYNSQSPNNHPPSLLIDGDYNTIWHSRYQGGSPLPAFPHWVSFDMINPVYVTKVALVARQNNNMGVTRFNLQGSLNGVEWFTIGNDYEMDPVVKAPQYYPISAQWIRYIKVDITAGAQPPLAHFAEFEVYTVKD